LASYKHRETSLKRTFGLEKEKRKLEKEVESARKNAKTQHKSDEAVNQEDDETTDVSSSPDSG